MILLSVLLGSVVQAKDFKLYHCQSADGIIVIQDRSCAATRLNRAKNQANNEKSVKPNSSLRPAVKQRARISGSVRASVKVSPQSLIDASNSQVWNTTVRHYSSGWQLKFYTAQNQPGNQASEISVRYYSNTEKFLQQDAFSYALDLYHQIRQQYPLKSSEFRTHSAYKIFNVLYQKSAMLSFTEYYIGKIDPSLWVFTIENMGANQQDARQLLAQLQAII